MCKIIAIANQKGGLNELLQAFDGQVCRLYGYQYAVGTGKGIYGNHAE